MMKKKKKIKSLEKCKQRPWIKMHKLMKFTQEGPLKLKIELKEIERNVNLKKKFKFLIKIKMESEVFNERKKQ